MTHLPRGISTSAELFPLLTELEIIIFQLITFTIIELRKGVALSRKEPFKQIVFYHVAILVISSPQLSAF